MMPHYQLLYYNEQLQVGMANWKIVFLFSKDKEQPEQLHPEVHNGQLVYRAPGNSRRITYRQIKKSLQRKIMVVELPGFLLPF